MGEIKLDAAIEAAAEPIWWESNPDYPINRECDAWDECRALARRALKAALPLIEEQVRERASEELRAWADQIQDPGISGPRAIRRRTLMAAASKILPKLSPAELAEKIASGEAFVMHCTALDIEDDQPLLSVEGKDTKVVDHG